ncbi:hypothetical protein [Nocardia sp. NPDC019302]|uniref:hypothetical protein n=1 Tax=Nocardia sp. NPDC019302 TaxID=3154592 RepID=UPI0033FC3749
MTELSPELQWLLSTAKEAAAAGKNVNVDPGYVFLAFEALEAAARARVTELTTALAEANDARMRHLGVNERLRTRIAELEAAQRPPLGYRDIADTLAFLAVKTTEGNYGIATDAAFRRELTDRFEDLLNRLPEGVIRDSAPSVREAHP